MNWKIKNNRKKEAFKYSTRKEFQIKCGSVYRKIRKCKWYELLQPKVYKNESPR